MGNCLARTRHHERLDDYPESDFETKPSYTQPTKPLWRRRTGFASQWQHPHILTDFDHQDSFGMPEESPQSLDTTCEISLISFPQEDFLERRYDGSQDEYGRSIAANKKDSTSQPIENPLDHWSGRRGGALELRLAKNRYLQLATSAHKEQDISPISMDPSIISVADRHASSKEEALKDEFEHGISNGVVWEEYTRRRNVTAIAMSRNTDWMKDEIPLLLAVGTEDGVLTFVEILDQRMKRDASPSEKQSTSDNLGVELNISLDGRIRAIDFSPDGSYVVAGGDGCVAYVMKIVRDSSTRRLRDVSVFQELERVDRIYAISFSPDNQLLSVGGFDSSVTFVQLSLLDSEDNFRLTEVPLRGLVLCLAWNQTKVAVGTSGENGFAVIDESFQIIHHVQRHAAVEVVRWKPDGSLLAVGDREVVLFDARTFDVVCELKDIIPSQKGMKKKYRIKAMCFTPDGSFLAIGGSDGICHVVESKNFALVYKLQRSSAPTSLAWGRQKLPSQGHTNYLGISDNSRAVVLFKAGIPAAHDKEDASVFFPVLDSAKSPKGDSWVLRDGSFRDIEETAEESPERSRAIGTITSIVFSRSKRRPNSSYLAYVSNDCSLTILSTRDWKVVLVSSRLPYSK